MNERKVGNFSENIPLLGFGLMRLPVLSEAEKTIDMEQVKQMADVYMQNGMNYFDTAYMYLDGKSENYLKQAVTDRYPREQFLVADKMPMWNVNETADLEKIFCEQLEKTGLTYFDFYLIHAMNKELLDKCERLGTFDFIKRIKTEGRAKHVGFSFHDTPAVLEEILSKHEDVLEFVQLQINYFDWTDETCSKEIYEIARRYNKPIIIMEPVKGGTLANPPEEAAKLLKAANPADSFASWAMRYCGSLDGIMTILSGMSNMEQMLDNIKTTADFRPISSGEQKVLDAVVPIMKKAAEIPCTNCKYCIDCPMMIDIPSTFAVYNGFKRSFDLDVAKKAYTKVNPASEAGQCIACKKCEEICPQGIKIVDKLKDIVRKFA